MPAQCGGPAIYYGVECFGLFRAQPMTIEKLFCMAAENVSKLNALPFVFHNFPDSYFQRIQGRTDPYLCLIGQMKVDRGGTERRVTHKLLYQPDVDPFLKKMGGKAVP